MIIHAVELVCTVVVGLQLLGSVGAGVYVLRMRRLFRRQDARGGFEVGGIPMQRRD